MSIFPVIRRGLWALFCAACIVIGGAYLAFSETFLTQDNLTRIVRQSHLAETVRQDILLPRVLASTRSSDYAALFDDKTVTDAFHQSISEDALNNKLQPAIEATTLWLNSKTPSVDFSIDMSDLSTRFADTLSAKISTKIAALPVCTRHNSTTDGDSGICRPVFVGKEALVQKIDQAIKTDPTLQTNAVITPETLAIPGIIQPERSYLPSYLNMFYAGSLIAGALALLVGLWLLLKHRLAGVVTIGAAATLAGITLAVIPIILTHEAARLGRDSFMNPLIFTATQSFTTTSQQYALILGGSGIALIIIGSLSLLLLARRSKKQPASSKKIAPSDEQVG